MTYFDTARFPCLSQFSAFGTEFRVYTNTPETVLPSAIIHFGETPVIISSPPECALPSHSLFVYSADGVPPTLAMDFETIALPANLGSVMQFDPASSNAILTVPSGFEPAARALFTALPLFVYSCLKQQGIFFLHAAAAASGGRAVAFIGENESGKSTLAKSLLLHGWQLLSDDNLPVLSDPDGTIFAIPNREAFNATSFTEDEQRQLSAIGCTPAVVDGFLLPPSPPGRIPIRAIIYPHWSNSFTEPVETSKAAALKTLYKSCKTPLTSRDIPAFDALASALSLQSSHYSIGLVKGELPNSSELLKAIGSIPAIQPA